eukprot:273261_1
MYYGLHRCCKICIRTQEIHPILFTRYLSNWPDIARTIIPDEILNFWFGEIESKEGVISSEIRERWFMGGKAFDNEIIESYGGFIPNILDKRRSLHEMWLSSLKGTVAYIVIADQFTRNVYRGTPKAFENDEYAQKIVNECIQNGKDKQIFDIHPAFSAFLYMPLMHSENIKDHDTLSEVQHWMLSHLNKDHDFYSFLESQTTFAAHHRGIVEQFGRFPQRNQILNRQSTEEEMQYIKDHNLMRLVDGMPPSNSET